MEEMVEVRKEVSDMPCGNAIPAEDAGGAILYLSISAIIPPRRNFEICYEHCNQFVGNDACIVLQTGCTQHSTHHTANNLSHRP